MQKRWQIVLIAVIFTVWIPGMMIRAISKRGNYIKLQSDRPDVTEFEGVGTDNNGTETDCICVSVLLDDGIWLMPLEEYVAGVVLAEMPASFEMEALKAQAVVARTYVLRRLEGDSKHADAAICGKSDCCQGYRGELDYLANGGTAANVEKVKRATRETEGIVLLYKGKLIEATYFSCSGGITEDAEAVWGRDVPYLQSIASPGEEKATKYIDTTYLSVDDFEKRLNVELTGEPNSWIGKIVYTDGQGVDTIEICGVPYKGTELRTKLGLHSTSFTISVIGKTVVITTKGYGHRVGMSQYGADAMAVNGDTYDRILTHYYQDVVLSRYR